LQDLVDYRCGDQVVGCDAVDAQLALDALVRLHSTWWDCPPATRPTWVPSIVDEPFRSALIGAAKGSWRTALDRFGHLVPLPLRKTMPRFVKALPAMYDTMGSGHQTLAHTDFRLDNLLFATTPAQQPIVVLDWSSVFASRGAHDVAFLLSQNVTTETRRSSEHDLIAYYHDGLCRNGVADYTLAECWDEYRFAVLFDLLYAIVIGGALDVSNERATAFVSALVERCATAITDLELVALMPS
jgi:aminoglycoside phosphotransferase (APT) family kinase protein